MTEYTAPVPRLTVGVSAEHMAEIYADPYITKVGHDHCPAVPIIHPQVTYLTAWVGDFFAGAFMVFERAIDFEMHSLLKKKALPWSRDLVRLCVEWAFSHPIHRLSVQIIEGFETAKNLCLKLGFKVEGTKRNACMQGGVMRDVYQLGLLREELWVS